MKIAMIGQKGVPATHGGVERHVEELGARLADLGHDVTVFTRPNYTDRALVTHRGMGLVSMPTIGSKHLDAIVHSVLCSFRVLAGSYDVVHYHAMGPCLASPIARLRGRCVVATIHGQDWRRAKWGRAAGMVLRLSEWMALHIPHATIVVSESLAELYRQESGRRVEYIPNGITIAEGDDTSVLEEQGLSDRQYILFAGRLVPEKGLHYLIEAHARANTAMPLVVAGDASMSEEYVRSVAAAAGADVHFVGYEYGDRLAALFRHAALFVLPSDIEGLPIVLLEALAYGVPVLASDIAPNVEVLGDNGSYFEASDIESLADALRARVADLEQARSIAEEMKEAAVATYDWDAVAGETEELYVRTLGPRAGAGS